MLKEICTVFIHKDTSCRRLRITLLSFLPVLLLALLCMGGYVRIFYNIAYLTAKIAKEKIETSRHLSLAIQDSQLRGLARKMVWTLEFDETAYDFLAGSSQVKLSGIVPVSAERKPLCFFSSSLAIEQDDQFSLARQYFHNPSDTIPMPVLNEISPFIPSGVPCKGIITSHFGTRTDPVWEGTAFHKGIDIANRLGSAVWATAEGTVIFAGKRKYFGNVIIIEHSESGYLTIFAHLNSIRVSKGSRVKRNQRIGSMGATGKATGPHLHYEIHFNKQVLDPFEYLLPPEVSVN